MDNYYQKVEVIFQLHQDQRTPVRFRQAEEWILVANIGRRWDNGQREHILVQDSKGQVYELIFDSAEQVWWLKESQLPPALV